MNSQIDEMNQIPVPSYVNWREMSFHAFTCSDCIQTLIKLVFSKTQPLWHLQKEQ